MDLVNLNLEAIFAIVAGLVMGAVPAFVFIGFYFGRRFDREKQALWLKYERQVTALRATLGRMMERIDILSSQRNQLQRANKALRDTIREQHEITDNTSKELEEAQHNMLRMEDRIDELQSENLRYQGRLDQAEIQQQRLTAQTNQVIAQVTQTQRLRRNLIFAATQLRESKVTNAALEARLNRALRPLPGEETISPDQMDVGVIEGLEPHYAQRLHESGIHTIGDLAQQTPARVAHFAGLPSWDDSAAWIAEAKFRVAGSSSAQA